ncbi:hypothetical protein HQ489_05170 [Candidatus Woesearchaeota archaeon]|nr:hypothetical protein [Candidatus Woesearchaeota archaeon]
MLTKSTLLKYYKRPDIQEEIIKHARDKEVGTRFDTYFGKRPDVLNYPQDVFDFAKKGLTSLHASEERWQNPLNIHSDMKRKEMDAERIGWDLVLDIDCPFMEYSKICADLIIKFLEFNEVKDVSCKFSGNKGFHIGVPFEAFPERVGEIITSEQFPEFPKKIALYIRDHIEDELGKRIMELEGSFGKIKEKVGLAEEEIIRYVTNPLGGKIAKLNVDKFLEIDTVLISSRHLYRMPYSLHEKSGLASLPIDPKRVMEFEKPMANPDTLKASGFTFLGREAYGESGTRLLKNALDYAAKVDEKRQIETEKQFQEVKLENPIQEVFFPPCIRKALLGMEDGKKRVLFVMMNYLGKVGWSKPEVEKYLILWNAKNPEPLREGYIRGQMHHYKAGEKLPPNCDNAAYYTDMGICQPDMLCKHIKNPVNYTMTRWKRHLRDLKMQEDGRKKKRVVEEKDGPNQENKVMIDEKSGVEVTIESKKEEE